MSDQPTLHKISGTWWIGELFVGVERVDGRWEVQDGSLGVRSWVRAAGLEDAEFRTRREAVEAVLAHDAITPAPRLPDASRVRLTGPDEEGARYDDRGRFRVTRENGKFWRVRDLTQNYDVTLASMWEVRGWIAHHRNLDPQ